MSKKFIVHIDIDSFFASAEKIIRELNQIEDIAIGSQHDNSIISSISSSLKKKGVKAGWKLKEIKKYSDKVMTFYPNINYYRELSNNIYLYLKKNFDKVETKSIDEWLIEINHLETYDQVYQLMRQLQNKIKNKFKIEISIGISFTCFLAKIGSKLNKPFGIKMIKNKADIKKDIWVLDISEYHGIGKRKIGALQNSGINTIGDLAKCNPYSKQMRQLFLNTAQSVIDNANGIGLDVVFANRSSISISRSRVFKRGSSNDINYIYSVLKICATELAIKLKISNQQSSSLSIIINKKFVHSSLTNKYISSKEDIFFHAKQTFIKHWNEEDVFMCGIKLAKLSFGFNLNQKIETENSKNTTELIINKINSTRGKKIVFKAKDLLEY